MDRNSWRNSRKCRGINHLTYRTYQIQTNKIGPIWSAWLYPCESTLGLLFRKVHWRQILGTCFIVGNWTENSQTFDTVFTQTTTASLALAAGALLLPVTVRSSSMIDEATFLNISRATCVILLMVYLMYYHLSDFHLTRYLLFLLRTHSNDFEQDETESDTTPTAPKWIWPMYPHYTTLFSQKCWL